MIELFLALVLRKKSSPQTFRRNCAVAIMQRFLQLVFMMQAAKNRFRYNSRIFWNAMPLRLKLEF